MAQADRETTTPATAAAAASWEIVCLHLYNEQEKKELLGYPPFTQRTMDEMFLLRAILGRLFLTQDDYDDLRRRLRSNGFSENLVALKVLPVTIPNLVEAQRRMKRACQHVYYEDEQGEGEDDPNTPTATTTPIHNNDNNKKKKRINVPLVDIYRMGDYCIRARERRKINPPEYSAVFCNNFFPPELVEMTDLPQCGDTTIPASHSESYHSLFEPSSIAMVVNLPSMVQPTFLEENHPSIHPCTATTTSAMMESPFLGAISSSSKEDASCILSHAVHDEADPPMDNAIHDMCHSLEPSQKKIKLG